MIGSSRSESPATLTSSATARAMPADVSRDMSIEQAVLAMRARRSRAAEKGDNGGQKADVQHELQGGCRLRSDSGSRVQTG